MLRLSYNVISVSLILPVYIHSYHKKMKGA